MYGCVGRESVQGGEFGNASLGNEVVVGKQHSKISKVKFVRLG